jgi:superfamily II DNA/RNA helicase
MKEISTHGIDHILAKLGIEELNDMQKDALTQIPFQNELVLISPTGTGKTLAYLLPTVLSLDLSMPNVAVLIIVPTREIATQIEQVLRSMALGVKINALYGGINIAKDMDNLVHAPGILIGTPGRIADHLRRSSFDTAHIKTLILDEFDKSLEIGFEPELVEIINALPFGVQKILCSATFHIEIPRFVGLNDPKFIKNEDHGDITRQIKLINSPAKDKLDTLVQVLQAIGDNTCIVFCNYRDTIEYISARLTLYGINHTQFYGDLDQKERERNLAKFRNGTATVLLSTDLAARGLDIPEVKYIVHYQLPSKNHEFIHRNGRTARMHSDGTVYVLNFIEDDLPSFVNVDGVEPIKNIPTHLSEMKWKTIFLSGGRKDKISKGDVIGFLIKVAMCKPEQIGLVELKSECVFVAVQDKIADDVILKSNNQKLKNRKIRAYEI